MNIEEQTADILSTLFEHPITVGDDITIDNEELWDSLKHLELIVTLEEEFGVKIKREAALNIKSMADINKLIKELKNC